MCVIRASVPTCQKRANFSFLRANVPINVPKVCRFFNLACQRCADFSTQRANVARRANFSSWRANMVKTFHFFQLRLPKGVPTFQLFFFKIIIFFIYKIYLYLIYFIYFAYFKYILSIYFYKNIFFYLNLYAVCKESIQKSMHTINLAHHHAHHKSWWKCIYHAS